MAYIIREEYVNYNDFTYESDIVEAYEDEFRARTALYDHLRGRRYDFACVDENVDENFELLPCPNDEVVDFARENDRFKIVIVGEHYRAWVEEICIQ